MQPLQAAMVKPELLKHQDREVKLLVATCICEITRITAPEAPYSDDVLKVIIYNCKETRCHIYMPSIYGAAKNLFCALV